MFKFLGFLLIIGLFGFLVIGVMLGRVIRFFGPVDKKRTTRKTNSERQSSTTSTSNSSKQFPKNEGEYVSYEEVKDEE